MKPDPVRALNRSYLARQLLLEKKELDVESAVKYLVALQAQNTPSPYVALFARLRDFQASSLSERIMERHLVRTVLMRGTIHLATANDASGFWSVLSDMLLNVSAGSIVSKMDRETLARLTRFVRRSLAGPAKTIGEIEQRVAQRFAIRDTKLPQLVRALAPIVQVPPRGVLGGGGVATWTLLESWIGAQATQDVTLEDVLLRYLTAYGPATVVDMQRWTGLKRLGAVLKQMEPRLRVFEYGGQKMYDAQTALEADPQTPAPVRFLGEYDSALLAHVDRSRIVPEEFTERIRSANGYQATFLVDGFVGGTWLLSRSKSATQLVVTPFKKLTKAEKTEVVREGSAVLEMLTGTAGDVVL